MWLDRLAGHNLQSSSQTSSRSFSPLPRRTSASLGPYVTSQRSGHTPRGSSLSLVSNDSTSSLLSVSKRHNGSNLKQSVSADSGPDPDVLLERILGVGASASVRQNAADEEITDKDFDIDFDFGGLSLRQVADGQGELSKAEAYMPQTIEQYQRDKSKFEDLHKSITACDDVLKSVEGNLASFRNDLAAVSADIETLQARSASLNIRLENRKAVEKLLGPVVEELSLSPVTISRISDGPIDESWVKALAELDKRYSIHQSKSAGSPAGKAASDLGPLLEKLVLKAVERVRDFLVAQIKALRSPHINAQILQQQNFLKFKDLFAFLHKHHETLADEISLAYMNTMRWYYSSQFARYAKALEKIKLHMLDKNDVVGHEDSALRKSSKSTGPSHDAFNLGRRIELLRTSNQAALPAHVAEDLDQQHNSNSIGHHQNQPTPSSASSSPWPLQQHHVEIPFRNFNLALADNATAEYTFEASFFAAAAPTTSAVQRSFGYVFESTLALGRQLTRQLAAECNDALGLLLCIRLNQRIAFELQRRRVPALDAYVNATNMLLWPRLQLVMDRHCESVRHLTNALPSSPPSRGGAAEATGGGGGAAAAHHPQNQQQQSTAPHVVTQRFGQLLHGVLALSTEAADDEPVAASLRRLRAEVEAFLTRFSQGPSFGGGGRGHGRRERFLYNNYSLVLTIIGDVQGKLAVEQQEHFESLKTAFQEDE